MLRLLGSSRCVWSLNKGLTEWGLRPCSSHPHHGVLRVSSLFRHVEVFSVHLEGQLPSGCAIWRAVEPGCLCIRTWRCFEIYFHRKAASRGEGLRCRRAASAAVPLGAGPSPENRCLSRERQPLERGDGQGSTTFSPACVQAGEREGCT